MGVLGLDGDAPRHGRVFREGEPRDGVKRERVWIMTPNEWSDIRGVPPFLKKRARTLRERARPVCWLCVSRPRCPLSAHQRPLVLFLPRLTPSPRRVRGSGMGQCGWMVSWCSLKASQRLGAAAGRRLYMDVNEACVHTYNHTVKFGGYSCTDIQYAYMHRAVDSLAQYRVSISGQKCAPEPSVRR